MCYYCQLRLLHLPLLRIIDMVVLLVYLVAVHDLVYDFLWVMTLGERCDSLAISDNIAIPTWLTNSLANCTFPRWYTIQEGTNILLPLAQHRLFDPQCLLTSLIRSRCCRHKQLCIITRNFEGCRWSVTKCISQAVFALSRMMIS